MVYIDTNILLDIVFERRDCDIAVAAFRKIFQNGENACISASAVTDLFYIIRKETHDLQQTYELMENIFKLVTVLSATSSDIDEAFKKRWKDFEDCLQYTIAKNNGIEYILTSNVKDFEEAGIKVMKPKEYLNI